MLEAKKKKYEHCFQFTRIICVLCGREFQFEVIGTTATASLAEALLAKSTKNENYTRDLLKAKLVPIFISIF